MGNAHWACTGLWKCTFKVFTALCLSKPPARQNILSNLCSVPFIIIGNLRNPATASSKDLMVMNYLTAAS